MAAPTNFRVEAIGQTQTILRWSYSGTTFVGIYRSTDGVSYSLVDTVSATTFLFQDTELTSGTKYWYKLSDDSGATFSAVKTVKTHSCGDESIKHKGFSLPRFNPITKTIPIHRRGDNTPELDEKEVPVLHRKLSKAMQDIEDVVKKNVFFQEPCPVCITDGAIVIDCADGCDCYDVDANTDINSISFVNCDGIDPCITFRVPPNTTVGICGFPRGHQGFFSQFSGDECHQNPINGGETGRTVKTGDGGGGKSKPGSGKGGKGSGGGGGIPSSCECVPGSTGQLTVRCCTDDCSMSCASTKSLDIRICGGTGPYNISGSAGLGFALSNGTALGATDSIQANQVVTITPPTNSGSGHAGVAYIQQAWQCASCDGSGNCDTLNAFFHTDYGCNDNDLTGCVNSGHTVHSCTGVTPDASGMNCNGATATCLPTCSGNCSGVMNTWDCRDAAAIAAGCNPCGVSSISKTFTVTDADGVSVVTTIQA